MEEQLISYYSNYIIYRILLSNYYILLHVFSSMAIATSSRFTHCSYLLQVYGLTLYQPMTANAVMTFVNSP